MGTYWRLFWKNLSSFGDLVGKAYRITETLWEMSNKHEDPLGTFLTVFPGGCVKMKNPQKKESLQPLGNKESC
jgi:hypothetical protein